MSTILCERDQSEIFAREEGDAWFERNRHLLPPTSLPDGPLDLIAREYGDSPLPFRHVCEVGCANGWRLAELKGRTPQGRFAGFDPSGLAIQAGREEWPEIDLRVGMADDPPFDEQFELVIVSFVLHWVSRPRLARTTAMIDSLVAPGGCLLISDFLPDRPCRVRYHHRSDEKIYTYKQDYRLCFDAFGTYRESAALIYSESGSGRTGEDIDEQDRAFACLLWKKGA